MTIPRNLSILVNLILGGRWSSWNMLRNCTCKIICRHSFAANMCLLQPQFQDNRGLIMSTVSGEITGFANLRKLASYLIEKLPKVLECILTCGAVSLSKQASSLTEVAE